jgi:riboflavin biosynthesis pyrimidine reductase
MADMMRSFEVLFDHAERNRLEHPAFSIYGPLGFPEPPPDRPWIFSNFVQSIDGIASLRGYHSSGADISQSAEDRWLMDLLRAHADAVLLGVNTLVEDAAVEGSRGHVYRIDDGSLLDLRAKLGRGQERNIFVTGAASLDLAAFRVFEAGESVQPMILTTREGRARLEQKQTHPHVKILEAGEGKFVDLISAMRMLRQMGIRYLLCEGGPTLNGYMSRAGLIDERFITISPIEVGHIVPEQQKRTPAEERSGERYRPTTFSAPGFLKEEAPRWRWVSCRRVGDHQFHRYRRVR